MNWEPKTKLGKKVKEGEIKSLDEIFLMGKKILEPEIVDFLVPNLEHEILNVNITQRVTAQGRKRSFQVLVVVGDKKKYVGIGLGKSAERRVAIEDAIREAKKNIIRVILGCGSWQCTCGEEHTLPITVEGKAGSVRIKFKPAPKGVGLVAGPIAKKILYYGGVKDIWSFSRGQTSTRENAAYATIDALKKLLNMRWNTYE